LAPPLDESDVGRILLALGRHGVLRFPDQQLDLASLKRFSELFGEIQGNRIRDAGPARDYPEIGCRSDTVARKAEPLTGSGPRRRCLPGVASHSLSLHRGTEFESVFLHRR
jgi:hypothetical protein